MIGEFGFFARVIDITLRFVYTLRMEKRYLLNLVASAVNGKTPNGVKCDYKKLFDLAVKQQVHTLVYVALNKLDKDALPEKEILDKWKSVFLSTCLHYAYFFNQVKRLLTILEEKKVDITLLKGSVYRELYPSPELRTMGDVDILIKKADVKAFESAIAEFGYTRPEEQGHLEELGYEYVSANMPGIEAFFSLREDFRDKYDEKYEKDTSPYQNYSHIVKLNETSATVHHIAHFAKHFYQSGAGIRFLADLYLLLTKQENLDIDMLIREMKALGLYKFFTVSVCTLVKYFDYSPDFDHEDMSDEVEPFLDYLIRDTVYGDKGNSSLVKRTVKKGKFRMVMKAIFPDSEFLCTKYPYFKSHKILLPIAWMRHIFSILARPGRIKNSLKYLGKDASKDAKLFKALED